MRISEGPAKLRARGLTVVEVAGHETRGNEFPSRPDGAMRHWTAGPLTGLTASLGIVTNGRGGSNPLPGPLCNPYQSRRVDSNGLDIVYWVADGKANHAGVGNWNGIVGNYGFLGLEIEWSGPNEAFGPMRVLTSELIMRGLMDCCAGNNPDDACEHREYALPEGRKIDTNLDGGVLRRRMGELDGAPAPVPTPSEDDMPKPFLCRLSLKSPAVLYVSAARDVHWVRDPAALAGYQLQLRLDRPDDGDKGGDVCVLSTGSDDPNIAALARMVLNLPFIGTFPDGHSEVWMGPHLTNSVPPTVDVKALAASIVEGLPSSALTSDVVEAAVRKVVSSTKLTA